MSSRRRIAIRAGPSEDGAPASTRRRPVRRALIAVTVVLLVLAVAAFVEGAKSGAGDVLVLLAAVMFGIAALALLALAFW
jgi:hypothetical protein